VTSAQVGEGKTSTALNLAIAFAQRGGPVLIVDADLRRPSLAKSLGIPNEKGLSSFLTGAPFAGRCDRELRTRSKSLGSSSGSTAFRPR